MVALKSILGIPGLLQTAIQQESDESKANRQGKAVEKIR